MVGADVYGHRGSVYRVTPSPIVSGSSSAEGMSPPAFGAPGGRGGLGDGSGVGYGSGSGDGSVPWWVWLVGVVAVVVVVAPKR